MSKASESLRNVTPSQESSKLEIKIPFGNISTLEIGSAQEYQGDPENIRMEGSAICIWYICFLPFVHC